MVGRGTTNMGRVVCGLALVLSCVFLPRQSFGFAFASLNSDGDPVSNQTSGTPITRLSSFVTVFVGFGAFPPGFIAGNGSGSWDENALQTLQEWNAVVGSTFFFTGVPRGGSLCGAPDGEVNSGWDSDNCGLGFGDAIAITRTWYLTGGQGAILDTDVRFNTALDWDAYDGPTRVTPGGVVVYDFRRTVLHEYGHVVGLGHPDMAGQTVLAVMNATPEPGSDPDRLTADDKNGIIALYAGAQPQGGGGGSSAFDAGLIALIVLMFALRGRRSLKARARE
jgi:hypothetical protein